MTNVADIHADLWRLPSTIRDHYYHRIKEIKEVRIKALQKTVTILLKSGETHLWILKEDSQKTFRWQRSII